MKAKIYKPAKSATQSGKAHQDLWIVEILEEKNPRFIDPLMKWTSVTNTLSQLKFYFHSKQDALKFAQEKNYQYVVIEPHKSTLKLKSYAANFL